MADRKTLTNRKLHQGLDAEPVLRLSIVEANRRRAARFEQRADELPARRSLQQRELLMNCRECLLCVSDLGSYGVEILRQPPLLVRRRTLILRHQSPHTVLKGLQESTPSIDLLLPLLSLSLRIGSLPLESPHAQHQLVSQLRLNLNSLDDLGLFPSRRRRGILGRCRRGRGSGICARQSPIRTWRSGIARLSRA